MGNGEAHHTCQLASTYLLPCFSSSIDFRHSACRLNPHYPHPRVNVTTQRKSRCCIEVEAQSCPSHHYPSLHCTEHNTDVPYTLNSCVYLYSNLPGCTRPPNTTPPRCPHTPRPNPIMPVLSVMLFGPPIKMSAPPCAEVLRSYSYAESGMGPGVH